MPYREGVAVPPFSDTAPIARARGASSNVGYVDDERTAALRAERLAERGYGDAYIRADLEQRGLVAEEALAGIQPEPERAARFAEKGPAWLARLGFALEG